MFQTIQSPLKTVWWLVRCELYKFNKDFVQTMIDMVIPAFVGTFIYGYILPLLGLATQYGGLAMIGEMVFFCTGIPFWKLAQQWIMDWENDRVVNFELTLPVPHHLVFLRIVVAWCLQSMLMNAGTIFIAKILLGNRFD
jgi:hypothetical protein